MADETKGPADSTQWHEVRDLATTGFARSQILNQPSTTCRAHRLAPPAV